MRLKKLAITKETKDQILFKKVFCTHYLKPVKNRRILKQKQKFGRWYSYDYRTGEHKSIVTPNPKTWTVNPVYELKEKQFSGFAVKIETVPLSRMLGAGEESFDCFPIKKMIMPVLAATVYFGNGVKRLVPLSCIKEISEFDGGEFVKNHYKDIDRLIEENLIFHIEETDGIIRIENERFVPVLVDATLNKYTVQNEKRILEFDVLNQKILQGEGSGECPFDIPDSFYNDLISRLRKLIKEKYGFEPTNEFGESNYDKLINFTRFPFYPQLASVRNLYKSLDSVSVFKDFFEKLKDDFEGAKKFVRACGIEYSPMVNELFLKGPIFFFEYLGLLSAGFRNVDFIKSLMKSDKKFDFALSAISNGLFEKDEQSGETKFLIEYTVNEPTIAQEGLMFNDVFGEETACKFIKKSFSQSMTPIELDGFEYFTRLYNEHLLTSQIIRKIRREGFTEHIIPTESMNQEKTKRFPTVKMKPSLNQTKTDFCSAFLKIQTACLPSGHK